MKKCLIFTIDCHHNFWRQVPALLLGTTFAVGCSLHFFILFWTLYLSWIKKWAHILLLGSAIFYTWHSTPPKEALTSGVFSAYLIQPHANGTLYRGTYHTKNGSYPCMTVFQEAARPDADYDYLVQGKLNDHYLKITEITPLSKRLSLTEWRYAMKRKFSELLERHLQDKESAAFASMLLTGDVSDKLLRYEFAQIGVAHLLAVSGFHFALLLSYAGFLLRFFCGIREKHLILLFVVAFYFLFVGNFPAVSRSALMAAIYLIANLFRLNTSSLNLLGFAALVELIIDPLILYHIGFQLSFLACLGILLFTPYFAPQDTTHFTLFAKHGYLLYRKIQKGVALSIGVYLTILPTMIYHFGTFPLLSLLYNLFFPALTALNLFLLPIPSLARPLSHFLLDLAHYPPALLDYQLTLPIPASTIPFLLFALFCLTVEKRFDIMTPFNGGRSSVG